MQARARTDGLIEKLKALGYKVIHIGEPDKDLQRSFKFGTFDAIWVYPNINKDDIPAFWHVMEELNLKGSHGGSNYYHHRNNVSQGTYYLDKGTC